ncbi:hypothetical protein F2P81_007805 [Scophthalmus maximus]|uniref:Uncharacterized protein n=1 Tax=Scophthalmus maximus TaxID=52904 RepID=A0A6A4T6G2_SCOMX|nr:hypothetical protein F2P81_007805 [Scophthalmus maximus]
MRRRWPRSAVATWDATNRADPHLTVNMYNFTGSYYKTKLVHLNRPINDPQSPHFQNFTEYIFHQKMTNGIQRQQRCDSRCCQISVTLLIIIAIFTNTK